MEPPHPGPQRGAGLVQAENARELPHEAHLHVSATELLAQQEAASVQGTLEITEMVPHLLRGPGPDRRGAVAGLQGIEVQDQRQDRRALGMVQPLHVSS